MVVCPMSDSIILLTSSEESPFLIDKLRKQMPEIEIEAVSDRDGLWQVSQQAREQTDHRLRLIAFCTNVIVPAEVLNGLTCGAYNFHPGSPDYPGVHAASFAIYDQVSTFGATAHEMEAAVDSGAIVGVEEFSVPMGSRFLDLEVLTYQHLISLFDRLLPQLVNLEAPLPHLDVTWGAKKRTQRNFEQMRDVSADMDENEIRLRWRAFG